MANIAVDEGGLGIARTGSITALAPETKTSRATNATRATLVGYGLPPDMVDKAVVRLGLAALVIAASFFAGIVAGRSARAAGVPTAFGSTSEAIAIGMIVVSAAVFYLSRKQPFDARLILDVGLVYEVVAAFGIAMAENITPVPEGYLVRGVSFVGILIIVFPVIVPTTTAKSLLAAFCAAAMGPLALLITTTMGNPLPSLGLGVLLFFPNFVCATLVFIPSRIIYRLGASVSKAQHMGSYILEEMIGKGGMGEVWRAKHRMLIRPAAVKLIRTEALEKNATRARTLVKRFKREAQATAALRSPHTVELYDFGTTADGCFFYVMELLDGIDLETLVEKYGPLPPERVVYLLKQACHSLADAHANGLIHRDIKPANIVTCRYGLEYDFVKVLDFGIATFQRDAKTDESRLTAEGQTSGTPAYMAPELAVASFDERVDVYALGCVAFWLLTGETVFDAPTSMRMILEHVQKKPRAPSSVVDSIPEDLDDLVLDCLEKDPDARPQSAKEIVALLDSCSLQARWSSANAEKWWRDNKAKASEHSVTAES